MDYDIEPAKDFTIETQGPVCIYAPNEIIEGRLVQGKLIVAMAPNVRAHIDQDELGRWRVRELTVDPE